MKQDDEKNRDRRGFLQCMARVGTRMSFHDINHPIAITDVPLEDDMVTAVAEAKEVVVDNFSCAPANAADTYFCSIHPRMTGQVVVG